MFSPKIVKLSRGAIPFFPNHAVQGGENEMAAFVDDLVGLLRLFQSSGALP
jgi:hypothetical protein